jgi:hypothetical protein
VSRFLRERTPGRRLRERRYSNDVRGSKSMNTVKEMLTHTAQVGYICETTKERQRGEGCEIA